MKSLFVPLFALVATVVFADAQSDLENKIAREVAGRFRAITAKANALNDAWCWRHLAKRGEAMNAAVVKDVVFLGDDAMAGWETTGADAMAAFGAAKVFNLGFAGDCTEHVLWRVTEGGEFSGYAAKAVVLTVGANNAAVYTRTEEPPMKTLFAIFHLLAKIRAAQPDATIVVCSILPRGADGKDAVRRRNDIVNADLGKWVKAKGAGYVWCDLTDLFVDGTKGDALRTRYFEDDAVTLNAAGYAVWANAIKGYVSAAVGGTAMPAPTVCERRPLQGEVVGAAYGASRAYPGLGYWDKLANFLYGNGVAREADVVLLGDSITERWAGTDPGSMRGLGEKVMNLGNCGDTTENLLWRLENGELDGYRAKWFNILIGVNNNLEKSPADGFTDIAAGVRRIVDLVQEKHPESRITLMPILPYGHTNAQNRAKAEAIYLNNERANELIKTFADDRRVFLVDVRREFLNADGTFREEMYVPMNGSYSGCMSKDYADMFLHLSDKAYREVIAPALKRTMSAAGASAVVPPSLGSAAVRVSGTTATISLAGVEKGTDGSGVAAKGYGVISKLDTAAEKAGSAAPEVVLTGLADGLHTCGVWVRNPAGFDSEVKRVVFKVNSKEDEVGWSIAPMDESGSSFRSSGDLVFAVGFANADREVNGIPFVCSQGLPSADRVSFVPAPDRSQGEGWTANNPIFTGGWVWTKPAGAAQELVVTFGNLEPGRKYLVQILASSKWFDQPTSVAAGDITPVSAADGTDYRYGAVVSRVFVASGATEDVKLALAGAGKCFVIKALQLRSL